MDHYPTALERTDDRGLVIQWSDDRRRRYGVKALRDACPCATCREKRTAPQDPLALPMLKSEQLAPLRIAGMQPMGNYAYSIAFSDGHDTGIYTFDLLRTLGEEVA
ncbi:MAG: DUF971 domain-containing protein [Pirellulaceae bacterium]